MMNRGPYPYSQASYYDPNQFNQPYMSEPNHYQDYPNMPLNHFTPTQTPFEHFEKPRQPTAWPNEMQQSPDFYPPSQPFNQPNLLAQFKDQNGQVDISKTLSTVGQFANTVQQVTPVIKQISDLIKSFR